jgi:hypothetical protein
LFIQGTLQFGFEKVVMSVKRVGPGSITGALPGKVEVVQVSLGL